MIRIETDKPVAFDSPDHIDPWGTARDNTTNINFVNELYEYFEQKPFSFLDLGCSGGQLVVDILNLNPNENISIGLEGSDYSAIRKRDNWSTHYNKNLFTCDITEPFKILNDDKLMKFDIISSWEVMEHLPSDKLDNVFQNIYNHLSDDGIYACSINVGSDRPNGVELHLTREKPPFWEEVFDRNGFKMVGGGGNWGEGVGDKKYSHHYMFEYRARGNSKNGCSFWTTIVKK
tara:strand:- start:272 stop:967 length:696 start_codon:yes stop_codon:yes gene_type:complete